MMTKLNIYITNLLEANFYDLEVKLDTAEKKIMKIQTQFWKNQGRFRR